MIYPIVSMASQDEKLGVYTEHMNMLMMDGEEELAAFEKNIFKAFDAVFSHCPVFCIGIVHVFNLSE